MTMGMLNYTGTRTWSFAAKANNSSSNSSANNSGSGNSTNSGASALYSGIAAILTIALMI